MASARRASTIIDALAGTTRAFTGHLLGYDHNESSVAARLVLVVHSKALTRGRTDHFSSNILSDCGNGSVYFVACVCDLGVWWLRKFSACYYLLTVSYGFLLFGYGRPFQKLLSSVDIMP